jgi:oligopeptide transport system ATP-binding protein
MDDIVLSAHDVVKEYGGRRSTSKVRALAGVSLNVHRGQTFGVVGESGCGKSTLARLLVGLEAPTSGDIQIAGHVIDAGPKVSRRALARTIQLVSQDPFSSLDPRLTVSRTLREVLKVHDLHQDRVEERVQELLAMVGLTSRFIHRYPHELSGGQSQRVAIARALAVEPEVIVLDEPTSALDVSVRAEIINLLIRIQDELKLSYLFISHDLSIVRHISDDIAVMYLGRVVEFGNYEQVLDRPFHPYTIALAEAIPVPDPEHERARKRSVQIATVTSRPPTSGCSYEPRCPLARPLCKEIEPLLLEKENGHFVSCHVVNETIAT